MRKKLKKSLLILFALITMAVIFCFGAVALDKTGQCGDDVYWKYNSTTKELVISGKGAMYDCYLSFYENYVESYSPFFGENIKTVVIESGVTTIGTGMFLDSSITSVTIPDSVTNIGVYAFAYSDSLQTITVDKNNKYYCSDEYGVLFDKNKTKLIQYPVGNTCTEYTIPDSVTSIGEDVFTYCRSLQSITVDKDNEHYCSDEYGVLFDKNKTKLIQYPVSNKRTEYTIPDSVTTICDKAFYFCDSLKSVTISDSVTTIGKEAFYGCDSLKSVTFGNNIKSIDEGAFEDCALKKVHITDMASWCKIDFADTCVEYINGEYYVNTSNPLSHADLYLNGKKVTDVVIPDGVKKIGHSAFYGYEDLVSVTIPDSVDSIGYKAFEDCTGLKSIYISDMAKWCQFGFYISDLEYRDPGFSYSYSNPLQYADLYLNEKKVTELVIPDGVKKIGQGAFAGYDKLTSVTIPDSVNSIGFLAFEDCTSIKKVFISDLVQWCNFDLEMFYDMVWEDQVSSPLGNYADLYLNGKKVTNLVIPDGVKKLGEGVFFGCNSITSITIPDSVTKIGEYAVALCSNLETVRYRGTEKQWKKIKIESNNVRLTEGKIHYNYHKHNYKTTTTKATFAKNGNIVTKCTVCGTKKSSTTIYSPKTFILSAKKYTYDGKTKTPSVTVKDSKGKELKKDTDYTVKYESGRKSTGKYTVQITFKGKYSGTKKLYFTITPKTTSKVTATQTTSSITLKWAKAAGATGYRVYRKINGNWKVLVNTKKLTYTIKKLNVGTSYSFAVKPYTVDGKDTILASTFTQINTATKCATPTLKVASTQKGIATLAWTNVAGESGYEVYGSSKKSSGYKKIATTKADVAKASKSKLKSKKAYFFKVRAYKTVDGKKIYSSWSNVKSVKVK